MAGRHADRGRLGIIAGGGQLPLAIARAARDHGENPYVIALSGEADADWAGLDHKTLSLGDFAGLKALFGRERIDRVVMSGSVGRRPDLGELRPTLSTIGRLPSILKKLVGGGDDTVLSMVIGLIEAEGVTVIGVQDVVPALLARAGRLGKLKPSEEDVDNLRKARDAARLIGSMDIGQGAVSVGGRVVALEGPEGTDRMLARVAEMREEGRISATRSGVLVKLCKPQQDRRVDLPSIGPSTVLNASAAGLTGIAVEAGRSLVIERDEVIRLADREGMFVWGLEPAGNEHAEAAP